MALFRVSFFYSDFYEYLHYFIFSTFNLKIILKECLIRNFDNLNLYMSLNTFILCFMFKTFI